MKQKIRAWPLLATAAALGLAAGLASARAEEPAIKLRVADVYPVGHNISENTIKPFMKEVQEATKGRVAFEYYPAEQLGKGKDLLRLTLSGVTDIGLVVPSYISDKMPLSAVTELPGGFSSSCQGTMAMWRLTHDGGILQTDEFDPNGVHVLIVHVLNPFQVFSTKHLTSLDELKGQKLRSLGALMDLTIDNLGGVPIHITAPEIHEAMSRGTVDGGLMSVETVFAYDLSGMVKSATMHEKLGGAIVTYTMSNDRWKRLPPDIQQVLMTAGLHATQTGCHAAEAYAAPAFEKLLAQKVAFYDPPAADRAEIDKRLSEVSLKWSKDLDARGKPGTAVLNAYREALAQTKGN